MKLEASLPNLEPKPYAVIGDAILYNGDCLEILNNLPEKSVDMIFADPPYNLSNDGYTVHAGKRVSVNKGNWDKSSGPEKDFNFHFEWIEACKRVLKDDGTIWISGLSFRPNLSNGDFVQVSENLHLSDNLNVVGSWNTELSLL